ncbi:MAG: SMC-Scp complex subunit ScpB [Gemmataceae bacterium]
MDEATKYASALGPVHDASADVPATPPSPVRIVEALLFAGGQPLTAERAIAAVRGLDAAEFARAIEQLARDYRRQNRPYAVEPTDGGYVLALRPRYRAVAERLAGAPREARLSKAAVDVLALVAFKQPVTRAVIDAQRGSDSAALVRQLVRLGLIAGQPVEPGSREQAYTTTARFLELFGLRSLDELPQTLDLQQL